MKAVALVGSHPRHAYIVRRISESGALAGVIVEDRGTALPAPPDGLPPSTAKLFVKHFSDRAEAEARFFGSEALGLSNGLPVLRIDGSELNDRKVHDFLRRIEPDLLLSYGCGKLSAETLPLAKERWNIHGGLSPWYRGTITHF